MRRHTGPQHQWAHMDLLARRTGLADSGHAMAAVCARRGENTAAAFTGNRTTATIPDMQQLHPAR